MDKWHIKPDIKKITRITLPIFLLVLGSLGLVKNSVEAMPIQPPTADPGCRRGVICDPQREYILGTPTATPTPTPRPGIRPSRYVNVYRGR